MFGISSQNHYKGRFQSILTHKIQINKNIDAAAFYGIAGFLQRKKMKQTKEMLVKKGAHCKLEPV